MFLDFPGHHFNVLGQALFFSAGAVISQDYCFWFDYTHHRADDRHFLAFRPSGEQLDDEMVIILIRNETWQEVRLRVNHPEAVAKAAGSQLERFFDTSDKEGFVNAFPFTGQ